MLTDAQLRQIMPKLAATRAAELLPFLNEAMAAYGIDTLSRTAAFVAQLAHESGEFRWMEEIWGPTAQQRRYEPPGDLATRLGNSEAGDGLRYKGRGPIQITGRFNYGRYGKLLGIDLIVQPELAATPPVAFAIAGLYWQSNKLSALADAGDFVAITKRINGGTHGLQDREAYHAKALAVLADGFVASVPATRGAPSAAVPRLREGTRLEPLGRGHEEVHARAPRVAVARRGAMRAATRAALR